MGNDHKDRIARWISVALCALVLGLVRQGGWGSASDIEARGRPASTTAAR